MSFVQVFRILWARRGIILLATAASLLAAILAGLILPARYQANARVMLNIVKPDPVTGEVIASQFTRAYVKTQTELITDYRVAGKVVDTLGWAGSPELLERYEKRRNDDFRDFRHFMAQIVIDSTNANLIEGSNILDISYTTSDPQAAAAVVEALRKAYVDEAVAFKREDATEDADWFKAQSAKLKVQLADAEKRMSDFERENGIVLDQDNVDQESRRLQALAGTAAAPAGPAVTVGGANPAAAQLAQIDAAIATAERTLGPNNPQLMDLKRQRAAVAATAGGGQTVVGGGGPSVGAQFSAQMQKVLAQRGKVNEARQLATDVNLLRDQYQKAAARIGELEQQSQSTDSGLTVLGPATAPAKPTFPNWPLILFGSLAFGLVIGVLVAILMELLARRVRGPEDLRFTTVPVIGTMTPPSRPRRGLFSRREREEAYA